MENYRIKTYVLDREQIYRAMMAEYALVVAGKDDEEAPMQYAKCDLPAIFRVLYNEELGVMCSKISGYIAQIDESADGLTHIVMRMPAGLATVKDALIRRRMEDYLVASVLMRCFVPVRSTRDEYEMLVSRARLAMRSMRQMLARG
ncbi:MAG: hypothetical protein ACI4UN_03980 [Muribaculaceae bacterium]